MTLIEQLQPYIDGNGLVCPNLLPTPKPQRGSDNGVLYTSQAIILSDSCLPLLLNIMLNCISEDGYLHRAPSDTSPDTPDDHYGLFTLQLLKSITWYVHIPWDCCQPGLLYMRGLIQGDRLGLWRLYSPFMAITIALSNIGESASDTSNKLLTWTMIKGLEHKSWLCKLGGKLWTWRMKRIYPNGTKSIAKIYFGENHPFVLNWKE